MTAIACWINREDPKEAVLTAVADSLVTQLGNQKPILDQAPKIFGIPLVVRHPMDFFNKTILSTSFGFAYSGNVLLGLQTYAVVASVCSNLRGYENRDIPSLHEIAKYIGVVLKTQQESLQGTKAERQLEAAVFGHCPVSKELEVYFLNPGATKQGTGDESYVLLLGDHKEEIRAGIAEYRSYCQKDSEDWWRGPQRVIADCVRRKTYKTIGGGLQAAVVTSAGYQARSIYKAKSKEVGHWFLNLPLTEDLGNIGRCTVQLMPLNGDVLQPIGTPHPTTGYEKWVLSAVRRAGWAVVYEPTSDAFPQYAYTIGLYEKFGHPELLVIGLSPKVAKMLLNECGRKISEGLTIGRGLNADLFENCSAHVVEVSKKAYATELYLALWFYGNHNFPVVQIVVPDKQGILPWLENCSREHCNLQPVLNEEVSVPGWHMFDGW